MSAARGLRAPAVPLTVIVPAHDEQATVGRVVSALLQLQPAPQQVLVVDDGSSDGTAAVARAAGARVIRHDRRLGNGAALRSGLEAVSHGTVAVLDADGQHDPGQLPQLLLALSGGARLAVGARRHFMPSGRLRALGNRALARISSGLCGVPVPDLTSGFRAFDRRDVDGLLPLLPRGFGSPAVMTLWFLRRDRAVAFVPVEALARAGGGRSHTRLLRDGLRLMLLCLRFARPALSGGEPHRPPAPRRSG